MGAAQKIAGCSRFASEACLQDLLLLHHVLGQKPPKQARTACDVFLRCITAVLGTNMPYDELQDVAVALYDSLLEVPDVGGDSRQTEHAKTLPYRLAPLPTDCPYRPC